MKNKTVMLMLAIVLLAGFTMVFAQTNTIMCGEDDPNGPTEPEFCAQTAVSNPFVFLDDDPNLPPEPELF